MPAVVLLSRPLKSCVLFSYLFITLKYTAMLLALGYPCFFKHEIQLYNKQKYFIHIFLIFDRSLQTRTVTDRQTESSPIATIPAYESLPSSLWLQKKTIIFFSLLQLRQCLWTFPSAFVIASVHACSFHRQWLQKFFSLGRQTPDKSSKQVGHLGS